MSLVLNFRYNLALVWCVNTYLTRPLVFFKVVAAKIWVTPTRLIPSTSTIWSLTWILLRQKTKAHLDRESPKSVWLVTLFTTIQRRFNSEFHKWNSWQVLTVHPGELHLPLWWFSQKCPASLVLDLPQPPCQWYWFPGHHYLHNQKASSNTVLMQILTVNEGKTFWDKSVKETFLNVYR